MKPSQRSRRGLLFDMLSYSRPAGESMDLAFRERFLMPLPGAWEDAHGNIHVPVGDSRVLFSCHTDTATSYNGRQTLHYDASLGMVGLSKRSKRATNGQNKFLSRPVLGADDTAGCFIMIEMIRAQVPGYYVFHYGEEIGGQGSRALVEAGGRWLDDSIDMAIAFDRRGYGDVITRQSTGRCCSDTFARALANALNAQNMAFQFNPCPTGIYTDTAEYVDNVPECTNLSVGYFREHSETETLDVPFLLSLSDALQQIDFSALPVDRDPIAGAHERRLETLKWQQAWKDRQAQNAPVSALAYLTGTDDDTTADDYDDKTDDDDDDSYSEYLDPEWERIQRALARMEHDEAAERQRIDAAKRRQPQVIVGRF
jgi:hypothetical protein